MLYCDWFFGKIYHFVNPEDLQIMKENRNMYYDEIFFLQDMKRLYYIEPDFITE